MGDGGRMKQTSRKDRHKEEAHGAAEPGGLVQDGDDEAIHGHGKAVEGWWGGQRAMPEWMGVVQSPRG